MNKYRIRITVKAKRDLLDIYGYISDEKQEPSIAVNSINKIEKAISTLDTMPKRHCIEDDEHLQRKNLRKLIVDNYLVFYIIHDKTSTVFIVRVLYAKRDWINIL